MNGYLERNESLRTYFDDKRREYFVEKLCSRNVADIIDNKYKESNQNRQQFLQWFIF